MRHSPVGVVVIAIAPPHSMSGQSRRASYHTPRRRKLSPEQEAAIRVEYGNRSLRELAADFGVGHQTVRGGIRRAKAEETRTSADL